MPAILRTRTSMSAWLGLRISSLVGPGMARQLVARMLVDFMYDDAITGHIAHISSPFYHFVAFFLLGRVALAHNLKMPFTLDTHPKAGLQAAIVLGALT